MSDEKILLRLEHIQQAAQLITGFMLKKSQAEFYQDILVQNAVAMQLVIIGEATATIIKHHPEFVAIHPEIPWRNIRGMKNILVHEYHSVSAEEIWFTATESLPILVKQLPELIHSISI